jgi:hypothetical protein
MYGYVFFRQVKDKSLKRGYFQKVFYFKIYQRVQPDLFTFKAIFLHDFIVQ